MDVYLTLVIALKGINNVASNLVLRSGLQFMLDNFKNFPVSQNETLEETFKYFKDTESIETIDDALRCWKNSKFFDRGRCNN